MARATIVVEKWSPVLGWRHDKGFPEGGEDPALERAKFLEGKGIPARVYRRAPDGPEIIYESPRP